MALLHDKSLCVSDGVSRGVRARARWGWLASAAVVAAAACAGSQAVSPSHRPAAPRSSAATSVSAPVAPSPAGSGSASGSAAGVEEDPPVPEIRDEEGIGIAPGPKGHLGAWLALGPFLHDAPDATAFRPAARDDKGKVDPTRPVVDDHALRPELAAPVPTRVDIPVRDIGKDGKPYGKPKGWSTVPAAWTLVSSGEGAIDLEKTFASTGRGAVGYVGGIVRVTKATKLLLLVGSDDGCEVIVDGKTTFTREGSRPQRDDDDAIPLELAAGDHVIVFKLHQHDASWSLRVRLVDATFRPPLGVRLLLPGKVDATVRRALARSMSWVRIVRDPTASGWDVSTVVRFPEGAPLSSPLEVHGQILEGTTPLVAPHSIGRVAVSARSVDELRAPIATLEDFDAKNLTVKVDVEGRVVDGGFAPRKPVRAAIARARAYKGPMLGSAADVSATIEHLADRLAQQVSRGDLDTTSQLADAKFLDAFVADAEAGTDPIAKRTGPMRLAHVARFDGKPQPIAVYVPQSKAKLPLYVGLHGMNGGPMSMLRIFFGGDDEKRSMGELERGMAGNVPDIGAYVIAPHAHGNAMYRQLGEEEVMDAIAWARARFPNIDPDRIYITGFSMGGIGAASIPLHHPDVFAAAMPLCGYHSYFIRRDVAGRPRRPWEQFLLEERSNVAWVDNGARLPLDIIHGKNDLPEENSGVLIDAYEKKGFSITHDHPDLGHDVWGYAYEKMQHTEWFAGKRRTAHPRSVRFRTTRPRFGDDAWVHVERMPIAQWATVDARVEKPSRIVLTTKGVEAVRLDRDPTLTKEGPMEVVIDGTTLSYAADAPLLAYKDTTWHAGEPAPALRKTGRLTGPIRDVWHEPLTLVYGTEDPTQTEANLEVARALAQIRWGVDVSYPIVKDSEVDLEARPKTSVILVGNAKSNRVLRALETELPMRIVPASEPFGRNGSIVFGDRTFTGNELGGAFVYPHPKAREHYVLVVAGTTARGTLRALSMPELVPDFVVWDERMAPARGQTLLGNGTVLAAGFFDTSWAPPKELDDPLAANVLKPPKSEKEATPYLP